jgi:hypothetical protein
MVSNIVGGVFKLPTAKFIDLVGRAEGFAHNDWVCDFVSLHDGRLSQRGDICCSPDIQIFTVDLSCH